MTHNVSRRSNVWLLANAGRSSFSVELFVCRLPSFSSASVTANRPSCTRSCTTFLCGSIHWPTFSVQLGLISATVTHTQKPHESCAVCYRRIRARDKRGGPAKRAAEKKPKREINHMYDDESERSIQKLKMIYSARAP